MLSKREEDLNIERFLRRAIQFSERKAYFVEIIDDEVKFINQNRIRTKRKELEKKLTKKAHGEHTDGQLGKMHFRQLKQELIAWLENHPDHKKIVLEMGKDATEFENANSYQAQFQTFATIINSCIQTNPKIIMGTPSNVVTIKIGKLGEELNRSLLAGKKAKSGKKFDKSDQIEILDQSDENEVIEENVTPDFMEEVFTQNMTLAEAMYSSDWQPFIQAFDDIAYKTRKGERAIEEILNARKTSNVIVSPNYVLVHKKTFFAGNEWYLYHLDDDNHLVKRNVAHDPSLESLSLLLTNKHSDNFNNAEENDLRAEIHRFFYKKAEYKKQAQVNVDAILAGHPTDKITKIFSSPYDHNNDISEQAIKIWDTYIQPLLDDNKKVSLLYSANQKQANKLYASYTDLNVSLSAIFAGGSGQAKLFREIALLIEQKHCRDQVHILPVPTSLRGGNNKPGNQVEREHIDAALQNVAIHQGAGFAVFGLGNEDGTFSLGGGKSQGWWSNEVVRINKEIIPGEDQSSVERYTQVVIPNKPNKKDGKQVVIPNKKDRKKIHGMSQGIYTEGDLRMMSSKEGPNVWTKPALKKAYSFGQVHKLDLTIFEKIEPLMIDTIKFFENSNHPTLKQMYDKIKGSQNNEEFWTSLIKLCRKHEPSFFGSNPEVDLLLRAIARSDKHLKRWPKISTLDELLIAQQKEDYLEHQFEEEVIRLQKASKRSVQSKMIGLKLNAYESLKKEILNSGKDITLSEILREDSPYLNSKVMGERYDKGGVEHFVYGCSIQDALYSSRNLFQATSKIKLDEQRDKLSKMDPRYIVLKFTKDIADMAAERAKPRTLVDDDSESDETIKPAQVETIVSDEISIKQPAQVETVDRILLSKLIDLNKYNDHHDIHRLIQDVLSIWKKSNDVQKNFQLMINKIEETLDKEERKYRKPSFGFGLEKNKKSHQDFMQMLKLGKNAYANDLLALLQAFQTSDPRYSDNTSDHTYQSIQVNFSNPGGSFQIRGITWNLLDIMVSDQKVDCNNPWNSFEEGDQYSLRKEKQFDQIKSMIENGNMDFAFLQDIDMYTNSLNEKARDDFFEYLNNKGWGVRYIQNDFDNPIRQKSLAILYNTKTLKIDGDLKGITLSEKHERKGERYENTTMLGAGCRFIHRKSRQPVNLSNLQLKLSDKHDEAINDEITRYKQGCYQAGEILIAGGDFNRPPKHIAQSIADPHRLTNLRGEKQEDEKMLIKRRHGEPNIQQEKQEKQKNHEKEFNNYDYFLVNGTSTPACQINSIILGGEEFKKRGKGRYSIVKSKDYELLPYEVKNGIHSYLDRIQLSREISNKLNSYIANKKAAISSISIFNNNNKGKKENLRMQQKAAEKLLNCLFKDGQVTMNQQEWGELTGEGDLGGIYQKIQSIPVLRSQLEHKLKIDEPAEFKKVDLNIK